MLDRVSPSPDRGMVGKEDLAIEALSDVHGIAVLGLTAESIARVATTPASPVGVFGISEAIRNVVEQGGCVTFDAKLDVRIMLSQWTDLDVLQEPLLRH
jgi:hypothetical protein